MVLNGLIKVKTRIYAAPVVKGLNLFILDLNSLYKKNNKERHYKKNTISNSVTFQRNNPYTSIVLNPCY